MSTLQPESAAPLPPTPPREGPVGPRHRLVIEAGKTERAYWADLWRYRELFWVLAWKNVAVRYKQAVFGIAWGVVNPVVTIVVFSVIFGIVAGLESPGDVPYSLLVAVGNLPWVFFVASFGAASSSLVGNAAILTKVYIPRLIMPVTGILTAGVDFAISFAIVGLMLAWYGVLPGWGIVMLPVFTLAAFVAALGPGLWFAALNARFRDVGQIVPFIIKIGMYVSPVAFSAEVLTEKLPGWAVPIFWLNPMTGVIEGFRWAILGTDTLRWGYFGISWAMTLLLLASGIWFFRKTERTFADVV